MNAEMNEELNALLDKINSLPFEEAYPIAKSFFTDDTRTSASPVFSDSRFLKWVRDNFKNVQEVSETLGLLTQHAKMEQARKNHEAKALRKMGD